MGEYTLIRIRRETAEELKKYGRMGQTYDDVIWTLITELRARKEIDKQQGKI